MRKQVEESVAPGAAAGRGRGGRFSAGRKRETVLRLLRGEDLESVSRALGITVARGTWHSGAGSAAGTAGNSIASRSWHTWPRWAARRRATWPHTRRTTARP